MAQQTLNREQETRQIRKEYPSLYPFTLGIVILAIGFLLGATWFEGDDNGLSYVTNLYTELISIGVTVVILDRLNQWRDDRRLKHNLLEDLKSASVAPAVNSLDRLRRENWLDENGLVGKDLQRANWEGAYIGGLNFENAYMRNINLKSVTSRDGKKNQPVNFKNANLQEALLQNAILNGANLSGAILNSANLSGAKLNNANLTNAFSIGMNLSNTHLMNAVLIDTILRGAKITNAHFEESDLTGAMLNDANLTNTFFVKTNLNGVHFEGTNLTGAIFIDAILENVVWAEKSGRSPATLPDGKTWTPEEDERMGRFTNPKHPEFEATLAKIKAIRAELGYDSI